MPRSTMRFSDALAGVTPAEPTPATTMRHYQLLVKSYDPETAEILASLRGLTVEGAAIMPCHTRVAMQVIGDDESLNDWFVDDLYLQPECAHGSLLWWGPTEAPTSC